MKYYMVVAPASMTSDPIYTIYSENAIIAEQRQIYKDQFPVKEMLNDWIIVNYAQEIDITKPLESIIRPVI